MMKPGWGLQNSGDDVIQLGAHKLHSMMKPNWLQTLGNEETQLELTNFR
jgi:hypothetical protein